MNKKKIICHLANKVTNEEHIVKLFVTKKTKCIF